MATYTIEIQASNHDGGIWQALAPSENVESDDTAAEVAAEVAAHQTIADGSNWRVRVWRGSDADTGSEPDGEHVAGTSIDDLAAEIADRHGIALEAAVEAAEVHAGQIRDDDDLWDTVTHTATPAGVEMITAAIDESYSIGAVATRAAQILVELEEVTGEIDRLSARRDELVRSGLQTELRRDDIAAAARVTRARLYQIRDGRR
ncbi:hypothetical protein [Salinispora vitiensis]|uniref:hypothetical protein n=1 Tax=Salinispora vitiensis TaxID=999544 RepID=UPI0003685124|nr:hypothetical protein [Salinispora vitiensis]